MTAMLEISLKRGLIGKPASQRKIVAALGLHKYGSTVRHHANPAINGMVKKIAHLINVRECKDTAVKPKPEAKTSTKTKAKVED